MGDARARLLRLHAELHRDREALVEHGTVVAAHDARWTPPLSRSDLAVIALDTHR